MRQGLLQGPIIAGLAATALVAAGLAVMATPSRAEVVQLKATLSGGAEVPPNDTKGGGSVTATYDTATKVLSWKGSYSGLTGDATAAHFHGPAEAGKNAGVVIPIKPIAPSFEGSATLNDTQASDLLAGRWYVNVHTDANKGGELRGQLTKL
jgi:hypothetical protein